MQNKMPAKITQNFSTSLEKWLGGYLGRMKANFIVLPTIYKL